MLICWTWNWKDTNQKPTGWKIHDSNPVNEKKKINALKSNQPKLEKIDRNSSQLWLMWLDEWSHTHTDLLTEEGVVNKKGVVTSEQGGVNSSFVIIDHFKVRWWMKNGNWTGLSSNSLVLRPIKALYIFTFTHSHTHSNTDFRDCHVNMWSNSGLSFLPKDTSTCGLESIFWSSD